MNCFLRHLKYRTVLLAIAVLAVVGMCAEGSVKRLEVRLPGENAWLKAAPMISFDGSYENSAEMKPVPDLCSWYYYEWGPDEKVPDSVVFFRPDDVEMNDIIGDYCFLNERGCDYTPIPLSKTFQKTEKDTLYYYLDSRYSHAYYHVKSFGFSTWRLEDDGFIDGYCVGDTVEYDTCKYLGCYFGKYESRRGSFDITILDSNDNVVLSKIEIPPTGMTYFCSIVIEKNWDFIYKPDSVCGLMPGKYTIRFFESSEGRRDFYIKVPSKTDYLNRESRIISPVSIIPKNGSIQISSESAKQPYSIMDSQGRVLRRGTLNQLIEIPVPSSGSYIVKVGNVVRNLRVNN